MAETNGTPVTSSLFARLKKLYKTFFEPVTFVLAIVAIVFAVKQYFDSRALVEKVEGILQTASTRYIGLFPEDISSIREIISRTCASLDVMVSIPGYGQYSSPRDFDAYKLALETVATSTIRENMNAQKCVGKDIKGVPSDDTKAHVRFLLFTSEQRKSNMRDQFGEEFLDSLNNDREAQSKFTSFFKKNPGLIDGKPEDYLKKICHDGLEDFLDKLEKQHHWNEDLFHHSSIEIKYSNEPYSLYMWLRDNQEAAFSFDRRHARTLITFRTNDAMLLDTFRTIFEDEWKDAEPYDDYWKRVSGNK